VKTVRWLLVLLVLVLLLLVLLLLGEPTAVATSSPTAHAVIPTTIAVAAAILPAISTATIPSSCSCSSSFSTSSTPTAIRFECTSWISPSSTTSANAVLVSHITPLRLYVHDPQARTAIRAQGRSAVWDQGVFTDCVQHGLLVAHRQRACVVRFVPTEIRYLDDLARCARERFLQPVEETSRYVVGNLAPFSRNHVAIDTKHVALTLPQGLAGRAGTLRA
jgi:hypothetical protein